MSPTAPKKQSRKKPAGRVRRFRPRLRVVAALLVVLLVAGAAGLIYLRVAVTKRFDGSLWELPARVYSDVLPLSSGSPISAERVAQRLDRCGYGRVEQGTVRPGQYRLKRDRIEAYLRPFTGPDGESPGGFVRLRFRDRRLISIRDERDRTLRGIELEPELLSTLHGSRQEERRLVRIEEIPGGFIDAVLAAEDGRFFTHHGLDLRGIVRAAKANLSQRRIVQGGSTITQQTVKNLYLGQQRTWWRKIREGLMAPVLDASYSKERILEAYLNEVYLGQRGPVAICGAQAASRFYFGRDLEHLSLGEWAMLAGLIRSPGTYNPFLHAERSRERRGQVLDAMFKLRTIDEGQLVAAKAEPLQLASGSGGFARAPYAVDFVGAELTRRFPGRALNEQGLRVFTTIDTELQTLVEEALREGLERLERERPALRKQLAERTLQGAAVWTEPASGAIRAMVGGRDYRQSQFNRVVQARRQPGSCFKPFVYAAGFDLATQRPALGLTPATLLEDSPLEMISGGEVWRPANYDRSFRGVVTARRALEESLNVPTVRAAEQVGLERIIATARRCGIRTPLAALPSLALGAAEVTPLELAEAYGSLAMRGMRTPLRIIRAVLDDDGVAWDSGTPDVEQAISPEAAYLISDLMHGVFERGTAKSARALGYRGYAAGKTGTTDDTRDAWFVGYDRDLLGLVWIGYDDNARTGLTGASGALPIWVEIMKRRDSRYRRRDIVAPPGIVRIWIDPETAAPAGSRCPQAIRENFIEGTEPQGDCPVHQGRFRRWLRRFREREHRPAEPI